MQVISRWSPKHDKLAILLDKVEFLCKKFTKCRPYWVARNHQVKYDLNFWSGNNFSNKQIASSGNKSCVICLEDVDICYIFFVDGCMHRNYFSCMNQHVEMKLFTAMLHKEFARLELNFFLMTLLIVKG